MVRDLALDMRERDLQFVDKSNPTTPIFQGIWGNLFESDSSISIDMPILNVIVPKAYWGSIKFIDEEMVCKFTASYLPDTRNFRIRLVKLDDEEYSLFEAIKGNYGMIAFSVDSTNSATPLPASNLPLIDIDGFYLLKIVKSDYTKEFDDAYIYSGKETDIDIVFSDDQEAQLLSLNLPGHNYRYPTLGVGITRYLNTVVEYSDLVDLLESQFPNDGKTIQSADFDSETGNFDVRFLPTKPDEVEQLLPISELDTDFFDQFTDDFVAANIAVYEIIYMGKWKDNQEYKKGWDSYLNKYIQHHVWHNGCGWLCVADPAEVGVPPRWDNQQWIMVSRANVTLTIYSSAGNILHLGREYTTLSYVLRHGDIDLTLDPYKVEWTRESGLPDEDLIWNRNHAANFLTVDLTPADMASNWSTTRQVVFRCTVYINDGEDLTIMQSFTNEYQFI